MLKPILALIKREVKKLRLDRKKIDLLRADKLMRLDELASLAKISCSSIYCEDVSTLTAGKIAKALGVSVKDILAGDEDA